jgi:hypothetical protein
MSTERDPQQGGSYLRDPETGELVPIQIPTPEPVPGTEQNEE